MRRLIFLLSFFLLAGSAFAFDPARMLPDPKITPGKIATSPKDQQGVTDEMERHVFASYHLLWIRRAEFKIDHLIPRELGGADHVLNLWPQSLAAKPYSAHRKELLTRRLVELVAQNQITLAEAQEAIRTDWISAYVEYIGMVYLTPGVLPKKEAR